MNIFALSNSPHESAQMQCDKHVVKMTLETAQILSTVHHIHNSAYTNALYKPTHRKHPCTLWAAENSANYRWLYDHFTALATEYEWRYLKRHLSWTKLHAFLDHIPPLMDIEQDTTPFARAMPAQYKHFDDPVDSYRMYYVVEKAPILQYTRRDMPRWLVDLKRELQ